MMTRGMSIADEFIRTYCDPKDFKGFDWLAKQIDDAIWKEGLLEREACALIVQQLSEERDSKELRGTLTNLQEAYTRIRNRY